MSDKYKELRDQVARCNGGVANVSDVAALLAERDALLEALKEAVWGLKQTVECQEKVRRILAAKRQEVGNEQ